MNWEAEIAEAKARVEEAREEIKRSGEDKFDLKGCNAYLNNLLALKKEELARTAPAGRNDVFRGYLC